MALKIPTPAPSLSSPYDLFAPSSETRRQSVHIDSSDLINKLGMSEDEAASFLRLRQRFLEKQLVDWPQVYPAPAEYYHKYEDLKEVTDKARIKALLDKLVVVQLNGGLGTGMGCIGPKSVLHILKKPGVQASTLLDCKVQQFEHLNTEYGCDVPLVLMNSFNTDVQAKKVLQKYSGKRLTIFTCLQHKFPLMYRDTASPVPKTSKDYDAYYPPGSGEVFNVLQRSGLLEKFISEGKEYIFVNNIENLSATVDPKILDDFASSQLDFLLEVTDRIGTDTTGGMPIKYKDNNVHILEIAQVPPNQHARFGVSNFKFWNTNNIWVKAKVLADKLKDKSLDIDFTVKYRSLNGRSVMQVETPASMAIHSFERKNFLLVPRSRFKPIKTTSQLLQVQSNMYSIENGALIMNPTRVPPTEPVVKLGDGFRTLEAYEARFKEIPNLMELDHLTVSGDVTFGANVTIKGTVIIVADTGSKINIPDGAVLENKIMAGSLLVLDH